MTRKTLITIAAFCLDAATPAVLGIDMDTVEEFSISELKPMSNDMKTNKQMEEIL